LHDYLSAKSGEAERFKPVRRRSELPTPHYLWRVRNGDLRSAVRFLLSKGHDRGYLQHQRRAQLRFRGDRERYSAAYDHMSAESVRVGYRADGGELPAAYSLR
jgi:hypothetical protein